MPYIQTLFYLISFHTTPSFRHVCLLFHDTSESSTSSLPFLVIHHSFFFFLLIESLNIVSIEFLLFGPFTIKSAIPEGDLPLYRFSLDAFPSVLNIQLSKSSCDPSLLRSRFLLSTVYPRHYFFDIL